MIRVVPAASRRLPDLGNGGRQRLTHFRRQQLSPVAGFPFEDFRGGPQIRRACDHRRLSVATIGALGAVKGCVERRPAHRLEVFQEFFRGGVPALNAHEVPFLFNEWTARWRPCGGAMSLTTILVDPYGIMPGREMPRRRWPSIMNLMGLTVDQMRGIDDAIALT